MTDATSSGPTASGDGGRLTAVRDWVLLGGSRVAVTAGIAGSFLVAFAALVSVDLLPFTNLQAMFYVYGGLISGNLTLITVVVSINQLLLSRELATPGELESQIENVIEFRREVEDAAGRVAPVEPLGFLRLLVEATRQEAQALGGLVRGRTDEEAEETIESVVEYVTDRMDRTDALLNGSSPSTIDVLSTMLATNFARQINQLRQVKHAHGDDLPATVDDCIDDLIDRLQQIDVARQYFKTIYFKQELSSLSRILLYTGLPAQAVAIATLLALTVPPGAPVDVATLRWLVPATLTVAVVPLAVLTAFILRTATVNRRTAATIPFTAPAQEK